MLCAIFQRLGDGTFFVPAPARSPVTIVANGQRRTLLIDPDHNLAVIGIDCTLLQRFTFRLFPAAAGIELSPVFF